MARATVKRSTKPKATGLDPVVLQRFVEPDGDARVTTPSIRNVRSESVDVEARTLTAIAVTGTPRQIGIYSAELDTWLEVEEQIVVAGMDLSRVETGMQFLDNHNSYERDAILGVVTAARVEAVEGVGDGVIVDVLISSRPDLDSVVLDLSTGILGCISCQYTVDEASIEIRGEGILPLMTVTKSTLLEVSLVSVPADPHSLVRSIEGKATMAKTTVSRSVVLKRAELPATVEELQALIDAAVEKAVADAAAGDGDPAERAEMTPEEQAAADEKAAKDKKNAEDAAAGDATAVRSLIRSEVAAALGKPAADAKALEAMTNLRSMAVKYGVGEKFDDMSKNLGASQTELRSFVLNATAARSGTGDTHDGRNQRSADTDLSYANSYRGKRAADRATRR